MAIINSSNKEICTTHKKIDSKFSLPDVFEPNMNGERIESTINSIIETFNKKNLTIKESLYALELSKEIILNLNKIGLNKIELEACYDKFYWFIKETLEETD